MGGGGRGEGGSKLDGNLALTSVSIYYHQDTKGQIDFRMRPAMPAKIFTLKTFERQSVQNNNL